MVKKNSVAKCKQDNAEKPDATSSRRDFLLKLWVGLGIAALVELIWVAASFLRPRRDRLLGSGADTIIDAGSVGSFLPGSVTAFPRGHFYLSRLHDGGFLAIDRRCTHLGCTVPWMEEEKCFVCPCHSSAYNIQGDVIRSPAPRPLDIFPITIENNMIRVNTHKPVRRHVFSPEQVVYPEKTTGKRTGKIDR